MKTNFFITAILLISALFCGISSIKAQDVLMVTLQHDDDVQVFYGATAFQHAYEAAESGDQITLSGGTFGACNINKVLQVYGAGGFVQDDKNNIYKTILQGEFTIELPEGAKGLHIEGINTPDWVYVKGDVCEMTLKRDDIIHLVMKDANTFNCNIIQCHLGTFAPDLHSKNLVLSNSIIMFSDTNEADAVMSIINCVQWQGADASPTAAKYINSIINNRTNSPYCSYYYTAYSNFNSMGSKYYPNRYVNENSIVEGCYYLGLNTDLSTLFNEGSYYYLKDEYMEKFLDRDLRPIGMYGGTTPFTNVPSNPQITLKEIAKQSDENGKLAVKIVVEAQK